MASRYRCGTFLTGGPTRHVMSGCVGSPTNGSENGRMAIGRGDASIGPTWAPCEVSAELSIVGAVSGDVGVGSDVGGAARDRRVKLESSEACGAYSVPRDSEETSYSGCVATQGEVLRAQRRVSGEGAALIWVGVAGECPAWQRSALASCGDAVLGKSEALRILDHSVRSFRRWGLHRVLKGRMSPSVGDARGTTVLAG